MVAVSRPYQRLSSCLRASVAGNDYGKALTPCHWPSHSAANAIETRFLRNLPLGTSCAEQYQIMLNLTIITTPANIV